MVDTVRTPAELLTLFADNTIGAISPQDARDLIVSLFPQLGTSAPTASAIFIGQRFINTNTTDVYVATSVGQGASDWTLLTDFFLPNSIAGLVGWWDFSDITSLFQDDARTVPITADGQTIGGVTDRSGSGNHLSQVTAGSRATYKVGVQNGLSVARLDGTSDDWDIGDLSSLTEGEIFGAWKIDVDPPVAVAQSGLWRFGTGAVTRFPNTDAIIYDEFGTTVRKTTGDPTDDLTNFFLYNVISTSAEWTSYINAVLHFTTPTNTVAFSATAVLGGISGANFDGDMGEVALFNKKLSSADRRAMRNYFNADNRWALGLSIFEGEEILTGTAAPTVNADFIGQRFIDTTNLVGYIAVAAGNGAADWAQVTP